jgi:hypothetical protein
MRKMQKLCAGLLFISQYRENILSIDIVSSGRSVSKRKFGFHSSGKRCDVCSSAPCATTSVKDRVQRGILINTGASNLSV